MKHYIQGLNECFPTAIAMYQEREPRKVIKDMLGPTLVKDSWAYLSSQIETEKGQRFLQCVNGWVREKIPWLPISAFRPMEVMTKVSSWPARLPNVANGFMTIVTVGMSVEFQPQINGRHIIAFDGVKQWVYDSNLPGIMRYGDYAQLAHYYWYVDTIYEERS